MNCKHSIRSSKKSSEKQRKQCKRSELNLKSNKSTTLRLKMNLTKVFWNQKKSVHLHATKTEITLQHRTITSYPVIKREKESMKTLSNKEKKNNKSLEKSLKMKNKMTLVTVIFENMINTKKILKNEKNQV